jgi:hypothetical protein
MVSERFISDRASLAVEGMVSELLPPDPCAIVAAKKPGRPATATLWPWR